MEYKNIEPLLDKYFAGETSLEEESALRQYFRGENVPGHLAGYKVMFNQFDAGQGIELPDHFNQKLDQAIRDEENKSSGSSKGGRIFALPRRLAQAAAIVLLIIAGVAVITQLQQIQGEQTAMKETYEDPEEAYEKAREALLMVSLKLNEGQAMAAKNMQLLEEKTTIVK